MKIATLFIVVLVFLYAADANRRLEKIMKHEATVACEASK